MARAWKPFGSSRYWSLNKASVPSNSSPSPKKEEEKANETDLLIEEQVAQTEKIKKEQAEQFEQLKAEQALRLKEMAISMQTPLLEKIKEQEALIQELSQAKAEEENQETSEEGSQKSSSDLINESREKIKAEIDKYRPKERKNLGRVISSELKKRRVQFQNNNLTLRNKELLDSNTLTDPFGGSSQMSNRSIRRL